MQSWIGLKINRIYWLSQGLANSTRHTGFCARGRNLSMALLRSTLPYAAASSMALTVISSEMKTVGLSNLMHPRRTLTFSGPPEIRTRSRAFSSWLRFTDTTREFTLWSTSVPSWVMKL